MPPRRAAPSRNWIAWYNSVCGAPVAIASIPSSRNRGIRVRKAFAPRTANSPTRYAARYGRRKGQTALSSRILRKLTGPAGPDKSPFGGPMKHQHLALLALLATAACGGASSDSARADSLQRDLAMAQADSTAQLNDRPAATPAPTTVTTPPARPRTPTPSRLASGTEFAGTVADSITSRRNKVGDLFRMNVGVDVKDAQGRT